MHKRFDMNFRSLILIRILDYIKRNNVQSKLSFYEKTKSWDTQQVKKYQKNKLFNLLQYAREHSPYYSDVLSKLSFSNDNCLSAVKEAPILTREIIQKNSEYLLSNLYKSKDLIKGSSSGTTGTPLTYYTDKEGSSAGVASAYALWGMSGWKLGQRNIHIWGNKKSVERWETKTSKLKNWLINQKNIPATALNDPTNFHTIADEIMQFNPASIEGYSSSIYTLAEYFKSEKLFLPSLIHVLTTAENLEDFQKELIEEVFGPTGDLYGSGEILGIATRPAGINKYYVMEPHVILETVESGLPGMKDILLTDLDNYGMPFIRYKIGDMIDEIKEPEPDERYPYGWFTKIHGRSSDIITLSNGKKFHPVNIFGGTLFRKFPEITRHKVIWDGKILIFVFETNEFHKQKELKLLLNELLAEYQVDYRIDYTKKILPSKSGKFKYVEIVSDMPN